MMTMMMITIKMTKIMMIFSASATGKLPFPPINGDGDNGDNNDSHVDNIMMNMMMT